MLTDTEDVDHMSDSTTYTSMPGQKEHADRLSEIRIVLLGYRRAGKSASGSMILSGQLQVFDDVGRTAECAKSQGAVQGRQVYVVDTPGWCVDASLEDTTEWTKREIMYSVSLCPPGPHCFLLVIALDKPFMDAFLYAVRQHLELFGERVWHYTMVLFTCGNQLGDMTIEQYIENEGEALQWVIEQCGNRYHVLNNEDRSGNDTQVAELLEKIDKMVAENNTGMEGGYYQMEMERFSEMLQCKREAEERGEERRMAVQTQRATLRSLMNDQSHHSEMSIVLLGSKLVGKSSTGNTILALETFETGGGTALCSKGQGVVAGRTVTVVDTPGWWANTASLDDSTALTKREIEFSACMCPPGPLAFLLVVNLNQPFDESYRTAFGQHVELLGDSVWSHSMVVFTYGECLGRAAVELHIEHEGEALQWLVEKCGNRYHVINNIDEDEDEDEDDSTQVTELLEKIDEMVVGNGGQFYKMDRLKQQEITQRRKEQEERAEERMRKVQKRREMLRSQIGEESHLSPLRMVLLGAKMSGKSSSANLILGQDAFEAEGGTALCSEAQATMTGGRQVTVVDTPGWFTTVPLQDSPTLIRREVVFSASLCPPGPHAVLLVVRLGDPVGREVNGAARQHLDLLGEGVWDHTLVLFTFEDNLGDATVEQLMECEGGELVSLAERCGNWYHVLNVKDTDDDAQVTELLEKVEEMAAARGSYEMDRERICRVTERRRADEERAEERRMKTQMQREALRSQIGEASQQPDLRIVLLGYKRFGKSSSGNTILGCEQFDTTQMTAQCVTGEGVIAGRQVTVVDTPGWLPGDPLHRTPRRTQRELVSSVSHCLPGPHAFLLLVRVAMPFSSVDRTSIQQHLEHAVGESVWDHTILLFTYGDCLDGGATIEQYIECEEDGSLQWLVDKCGNRYHVLSNEEREDDSQVRTLLQRIEELVAVNRGRSYQVDAERLLEAKEMKDEEEESVEERQMKVYKDKNTLKYVMGDIDKLPELSIILVGCGGMGKSSAVGTILNQREPGDTDTHTAERTCMASSSQATVAGRRVTVVDTPGWLADDDKDTPQLIKAEIVSSVLLCPPPGPSCLLLTTDTNGSFTEERRRAEQHHVELFGEGAWRHAMVLFTHGDWLGDITIEQYIESEGEALQWVIEQCGNRYHVLNNKDRNNNSQVSELLEKIEEMVARNGGSHFEMDRGQMERLEEDRREQQRRGEERRMKVQTRRETLRPLTEKRGKMSHLNIVLLGYKGSGITWTGNTILGREGFDSTRRTSLCVKRQGEVAGRWQVTVVDTPGWRNHHTLMETPKLTQKEVALSVTVCPPGPHAVLLVLRLDFTFRQEHRRAVEEHLGGLLGPGVWRHTLVLFTCGDRVGNPNVERFIESEGEPLQWVIEQCGNRYHVFNNEDRSGNSMQVAELLEKIEEMVAENGGQPYRGKPPQLSAVRLVLLGCQSSGKSFAGNAILGRVEYGGTTHGTLQSAGGHRDIAGRRVTVIRSPGWGVEVSGSPDSPADPPQHTIRETVLHVLQCSPGPHALLLAVRVDAAFTEVHRKAVQQHLEALGEDVWRHCLVLFTLGECLGDAPVEQHIAAEGEALWGLVQACGNRYHVLNTDTGSLQDDSQVTELLEKVEGMVAENGGGCFDVERNVAVRHPEWSSSLVEQQAGVGERKGTAVEWLRRRIMDTQMAKSMDTPPMMGKEDRSDIPSESSGIGTLESRSESSARWSLRSRSRSSGTGSVSSISSRSVGQYPASNLESSRGSTSGDMGLPAEGEEDCGAERGEEAQADRKRKSSSLEDLGVQMS